jgi:hypothetical protein
VKKVLYGFILVLCLAGGLGVGIMRQKWHTGGGAGTTGDISLTDPNQAGTPETVATDATSTSLLTDASTPMEAATSTPVEMATSTEPSVGDISGRGADPTPAPTSRSFGSTDTVSTHSSSFDSSSGTTHASHKHSSDVAMSDPVPRGTPVPKNQVKDSNDFGNEVFDTPADTGSKHSKTKATPEPTPVAADPVDDLPVVDDSNTSSTPEPEPTRVASIPSAMSSGGGELTFPAGNGGSYLKKVTQRQNGDKTIVHIDFAGDAKYRVFRVKNPNRVLVDFEETAVPGGDPQPVSGSAQHVKEISARELKNAGGLPIARVQIVLTDSDAVPNVSNEATKGGVDVVIGGGDKF